MSRLTTDQEKKTLSTVQRKSQSGTGGRAHLQSFFSLSFQAAKDSDCVCEPRVFPAAGRVPCTSSGDTGLCIHSWWVLTWNCLLCPFPCFRTLLGESINKLGAGEAGGRTRLQLRRLPKHLSQWEILILCAVLLSQWEILIPCAVLLGAGLQHMVLLGQALQ